MKHTPGPWNIVYDTHFIDSIRVKQNKDLMGDYQGCIICDFTRSHGKREHAYKETEANAKLIAAAPDLLEACQKAWNYILWAESGYQSTDDCKESPLDLLQQAIQKATE